MTNRTEPAAGIDPDRILKVGSQVFLFHTVGGKERKLPSQLLGWKAGGFLLVSLPRGESRFPVDAEVVLRYVVEGEVFGLRSRVIRVQYQPSPMLFLAFPQEIENVPLRGEARVPVRLPTVIHWMPGSGASEATAFGVLRDLTTDGGLLELALPDGDDPVGRSLYLTFLVGEDDDVQVSAQVRNLVRDGDVCRLGVSFHWTSDADQRRVETFCRLH
ncbi:MAG: flagellar brake protein [Leptospirillia bacterium]